MSDNQLLTLRQKIDAIDIRILDLLNQRACLAQQVGHIKAETNAQIFRPEREIQVLRRTVEHNLGPLRNFDIQTIFREIMSACRVLEKRVVVAYLGPQGTFSEQAVYQQFGHAIRSLPCTSIDQVFHDTEAGITDFGVVPVENSSEGVVNRTLDLLLQTTLRIGGEISIPIHHNLMTKSGDTQKLVCICAHPQALAQCNAWLNKNYPGVMRQAVSSNAEAARMASEDIKIGAIAGEIAKQKYNLQIVNAHIQDNPHNCTRFIIIGHLQTARSGQDQTSIILSIPNKIGAMSNLLEPLTKHAIPMIRFESRPMRVGMWEYYFYIDLEGHEQDIKIAAALSELKINATFFKLLGSYPCTT